MKWRPVDYIAVLFSVVIATALLMVGTATLFLGAPLSDARARLVEIVISAVLSIISMYVGAQIQKKRDQDEK